MKITSMFKDNPRPVITINPNATAKDALKLLNEYRIGALMVVRGSDVVGIMTERDILKNIHKMQCFKEDTLVEEIMTPKGTFVQGKASNDLQAVMQIMTDKKVRHLPIFDGDEMIGLVSIGDVIKALLDAAKDENQLLKEYISGAY